MAKGGGLWYNGHSQTKRKGCASIKLFQTAIEPRCAYCARGRELDPGQIVCPKKGVMSAGSHCGAFRYDPLKRVPPRPAKLSTANLNEEDFKL